MSKSKKKRNKAYRGADAKAAPPQVHRYQAIQRNALSQWWFDRRRFLKPVIVVGLIAGFITWLIVSFLTNLY
ncbi:MAG TPA: hypothetical protein VFG56_01475 [Candidatus Saccharimonadales bacterium]|nr:hypothetical protein [Candidatus Saccharimonadales bacterium]